MSQSGGRHIDDEPTTLAFLDGEPITLDEPYYAGERINVRADFEDPDSAWRGIYELARGENGWELR